MLVGIVFVICFSFISVDAFFLHSNVRRTGKVLGGEVRHEGAFGSCYEELKLQTPPWDDSQGIAGDSLTCYYYSSSAAKCASSVTMSSFNAHIEAILFFIGFKTESDSKGKIQLIQLSSHNVAINIHRRSGLFQSSLLKDLLSNKIPGRENRIVFCGADLAAHAIRLLGLTDISSPMKLHRALDITPIFSEYLNPAKRKIIPPAVDSFAKKPT